MSLLGDSSDVKDGAPQAKKLKAGGGGGGGGGGSALGGGMEVSPIPRGLRSSSITINLSQRSWEEISSTALYYVALSQSLWAMIDDENIRQLLQWFGRCKTFCLNKVWWKASNFIILNDILGTGANPTEVTGRVIFSQTQATNNSQWPLYIWTNQSGGTSSWLSPFQLRPNQTISYPTQPITQVYCMPYESDKPQFHFNRTFPVPIAAGETQVADLIADSCSSHGHMVNARASHMGHVLLQYDGVNVIAQNNTDDTVDMFSQYGAAPTFTLTTIPGGSETRSVATVVSRPQVWLFDQGGLEVITYWNKHFPDVAEQVAHRVELYSTDCIPGNNVFQISSIVQRAKIVHFSPRYKNGRRYHMYDNHSGQLITFTDQAYQPVIIPGGGPVSGRPGITPVPAMAANRAFVIKSDIETNFEDITCTVGGQTAGGIGAINSFNAFGENDLAGGISDGTDANSYVLANVSGAIDTELNVNQSTIPSGNLSLQQYVNNPDDSQMIKHVKNLSNFKILGGDDMIEKEVVTNMNGMTMTPKTMNMPVQYCTNGNWQGTYPIDSQYKNMWFQGLFPMVYGNANPTATNYAKVDPIWPNYTNPVMGKSSYLSPVTQQWLNRSKSLNHDFLTMIPIIQSSGGVLNQRANYMFEQYASMTFTFEDGWDNDEAMTNLEGAFIRGWRTTGWDSVSNVNKLQYKTFIQ